MYVYIHALSDRLFSYYQYLVLCFSSRRTCFLLFGVIKSIASAVSLFLMILSDSQACVPFLCL